MGKVLHASGSGWFPNCVNTSSSFPFPPPSSAHPFSVSLAQGLEIYWRVKRWDISISAGYYNSDGSLGNDYSVYYANAYIGTFQKDYTFDGAQHEFPNPSGLPPSTEEELVCNPRYISTGEKSSALNWGPYDQSPFGYDNEDTRFLIVVSAFNQSGAGITIEHVSSGFYISDDVFYPRFSSWYGRWLGGFYDYFSYNIGGQGYSSYGIAGNLIYSLSNETISRPIYYRSLAGAGSSAYLNITYSAKEWWSYGGTYNTSTGLPL
jgi:hypothetical protein